MTTGSPPANDVHPVLPLSSLSLLDALMLRDYLLSSLSSLPGSRRLHLHVLVSTPRKHSNLFPYARAPFSPKVQAQDILILLSEDLPAVDATNAHPSDRRVFVSAIEAYFYTVPSSHSSILYISKVDSTGQGLAPGPTRTLVQAFLVYFADPINRQTDNLWIHVFARAQNQYLFPNSVEHPDKRVLSDARLCQWWKRILGTVARRIQDQHSPIAPSPESSQVGVVAVKAYYILPGLPELEALQTMGESAMKLSFNDAPWIYGHPYSEQDLNMPTGVCNFTSIAELVPFLPDDPKSRFLDELHAPNNAQQHPQTLKKRRKASHGEGNLPNADEDPVADPSVSVKPDEFWEMMSFRQECSSGAITGFFVVHIRNVIPKSLTRPVQPQAGQVSKNIIERTLKSMLTAHEFSTDARSIHSTDTLETSIRGLCEGLKDPSSQVNLTFAEISMDNPVESQDSLELYRRHIYGSVSISNAPIQPRSSIHAGVKRSAESEGENADQNVSSAVTILSVKKKPKKPKTN